MLLKILLFIVIAYFIIKFLYRPKKKSFTEPRQGFKTPNKEGAVETLLSCPVCGTFFPKCPGSFKGWKNVLQRDLCQKNKINYPERVNYHNPGLEQSDTLGLRKEQHEDIHRYSRHR